MGAVWPNCGDDWSDLYCGVFNPEYFPDGDYIGVWANKNGTWTAPPEGSEFAYTVTEFTIDLE